MAIHFIIIFLSFKNPSNDSARYQMSFQYSPKQHKSATESPAEIILICTFE